MSKLTLKEYLELDKFLKQEALKDLGAFIVYNNANYDKPKHLKPIVEELNKIGKETIKIMFSVPPQHGKSTLLVNLIPKLLSQYPQMMIGYASYSRKISVFQTKKAIQIYKKFNINIKPLTDTEDLFLLETGGGLITTSVEGGLTGYPLDLLIIDDPIENRRDAESLTMRTHLHEWWDSVADTRLRENKTSVIIVQTRWHNNDLIGYLQKNDPSIKYINIPAMDENNKPLYFSLEFYEKKKLASPYTFYSLYQGTPIAKSSHLFKDFVYTDVLPTNYQIGIGLDLAYTATSKADYSVYVVMLKDYETNKYIIIKAKCWQADINETKNILLRLRNEYPNIKFGIEANGTQKAIYDMLKDVLRPLKTMELKGDKFVRAQDFSSQWNLGNVLIYSKGDIDNQFFEQIAEFSGLKDLHDDFIDGAVYAYELSKKKEVEYRKFG